MASKLATVLVLLVAALVPERCHGLYNYNRKYWGAADSKGNLNSLSGSIGQIVLHPTETGYCNVGTCGPMVKEMQTKHMNKGYKDIGYNFVVGGCTGVFEGVGWDQEAPFAENENIPAIHLAVVGKYDAQNVATNVAHTVKALINEGISKGKISTSFHVKCQSAHSNCPPGFMDVFKPMYPNLDDEQDVDYIEIMAQ